MADKSLAARYLLISNEIDIKIHITRNVNQILSESY